MFGHRSNCLLVYKVRMWMYLQPGSQRKVAYHNDIIVPYKMVYLDLKTTTVTIHGWPLPYISNWICKTVKRHWTGRTVQEIDIRCKGHNGDSGTYQIALPLFVPVLVWWQYLLSAHSRHTCSWCPCWGAHEVTGVSCRTELPPVLLAAEQWIK